MAHFEFIDRHNQSVNFAVASYETRDSILKVLSESVIYGGKFSKHLKMHMDRLYNLTVNEQK